MEIRNTEDLKKAYPDLVNQLVDAAKLEGQTQERQRLQAIDEVANVVGAELVNSAKYTNPIDAKELLFEAAKDGQLVNRSGAAMLAGFSQDAQVVNIVGGFANSGVTPPMNETQKSRRKPTLPPREPSTL